MTNILDPGRPLDEKDFFLGRQLMQQLQNETTDGLMLPPKVRLGQAAAAQHTMEELELIGDEYVKNVTQRGQKNALASVR